MFTTKIPNVKVASATVYGNTCKNVLLTHRPKRYSTSRKHQCLCGMAKRKKRHYKTSVCHNLQDGLNGNLIKQKFTV